MRLLTSLSHKRKWATDRLNNLLKVAHLLMELRFQAVESRPTFIILMTVM